MPTVTGDANDDDDNDVSMAPRDLRPDLIG